MFVQIAARLINIDWRVDPLLIKCLIGSLRSCGIENSKNTIERAVENCAYVVTD